MVSRGLKGRKLTRQCDVASVGSHPATNGGDELSLATFSVDNEGVDGTGAKPLDCMLAGNPWRQLTELVCPVADERRRTRDDDLLTRRLAGDGRLLQQRPQKCDTLERLA